MIQINNYGIEPKLVKFYEYSANSATTQLVLVKQKVLHLPTFGGNCWNFIQTYWPVSREMSLNTLALKKILRLVTWCITWSASLVTWPILSVCWLCNFVREIFKASRPSFNVVNISTAVFWVLEAENINSRWWLKELKHHSIGKRTTIH